MEGSMNKSYLLIAVIATIILITALIFSFVFISRRNASNDNSDFVFKEEEVIDPTVNTGSDLGVPREEAEENRGYKVSDLASKLPQNGQNFSLSYDFNTDEFTLYINPDAQEQGNSELMAFLKQNQIDSVSWLYNLKRVSQKP